MSDVVVSDMFMPGGSSLLPVTARRADADRADVPVIVLSGRALPGDVASGTALGRPWPQRSREALESGDAQAVEERAHRPSGSAATVGAAPLPRLCEQLEEAARAGALLATAPSIAALTRQLELTCSTFEDLAREVSPAAPAPPEGRSGRG